ncbi:hypothetical protein BDW72DRAFT_177926 [Aspergillus terricola var. indicus]
MASTGSDSATRIPTTASQPAIAPDKLWRQIESVLEPSSNRPPVQTYADNKESLHRAEDWRRYQLRKHARVSPLVIIAWNPSHPVIWGNVVLLMVTAALLISYGDGLLSLRAVTPLVVGFLCLGMLDYQLSRWWLRKRSFRLDPTGEWFRKGIVR